MTYRIDVVTGGIRRPSSKKRWRTFRAAFRNYCDAYRINPTAILVNESNHKELSFQP